MKNERIVLGCEGIDEHNVGMLFMVIKDDDRFEIEASGHAFGELNTTISHAVKSPAMLRNVGNMFLAAANQMEELSKI